MKVEKISLGPDETKKIGFKIGKLLKPGDVVGLYGELGTGKTMMVKGIANAFGINEREVTSASFTIITEYDTTPPFSHIDLYRIEKDTQLIELGLRDHTGGDNVSVVEWAEKAERDLPEDMIKVRFKSFGENMRKILIEVKDEKNWDTL
ncbi:MAG: tRNA (adenosine(37)-N6)-threonylcarbamoyltransferase complex ATPase subunit type 1 TsaE [Nitrospirae bacterium RBG_13_39_12]|nr:MAG: tRNA (adenosine(37)-N6)-threonylcarbamoyltransferase complex ATPase subunit type 1 TsaE [Nitrospirae bacterium RBG_13_39_12]